MAVAPQRVAQPIGRLGDGRRSEPNAEGTADPAAGARDLGGKPPLVRREVLEIFNASHDTPLDRRLRFDA
jgi:hypothetical protein